MPTGTVSRFFFDKGFGFISPDDGSEDVFVHRRNCAVPGMTCENPDMYLEKGTKVEYEVFWDDKHRKLAASSCSGFKEAKGGGKGEGGGGCSVCRAAGKDVNQIMSHTEQECRIAQEQAQKGKGKAKGDGKWVRVTNSTIDNNWSGVTNSTIDNNWSGVTNSTTDNNWSGVTNSTTDNNWSGDSWGSDSWGGDIWGGNSYSGEVWDSNGGGMDSMGGMGGMAGMQNMGMQSQGYEYGNMAGMQNMGGQDVMNANMIGMGGVGGGMGSGKAGGKSWKGDGGTGGGYWPY